MYSVRNGGHVKDGVIWKYSTIMDTWTKLMTTHLFRKSCFDKVTNTVYTLAPNATSLTKADILSKESKTIVTNLNIESFGTDADLNFL